MIPLGHPEGYDAYIEDVKHFIASHACGNVEEAMTVTKGHIPERVCAELLEQINAEMSFFDFKENK